MTTFGGSSTRRSFIRGAGKTAAVVAAAAKFAPSTYAASDQTIRLSLIGCGPRGTGAVGNALNVKGGHVELYAMADLYDKKMDIAQRALEKRYPDGVHVSDNHKFTGFDAYKKAIDVLSPGDVALCTTRAYIRPVHVAYAVSKGINVFMEKPFSPDPAGLKRLLKAGEEADKKGVKVAAGLQCRHSPARAALIERIKTGVMGDISYIRANRLGRSGPLGNMGDKANSLEHQLMFGKFNLLWVGSGRMIDHLIHQIDECCWLMGGWPVSCHGMGGKAIGIDDHGQNMDTYSMEFTWADGRKAMCGFRSISRSHDEFATFVHGTKAAAQFSGNGHKATVHQFKDQRIGNDNIAWTPTDDAMNPWDYEWVDFIDAIRNNKPYNETHRAVQSDYASLMGRAAAHLNRIVTWDEVTGSNFAFCDAPENLSFDSKPPAIADENGYFPAPVAGKWTEL
ncbi:Gfo/Idh/MocA family oxidoreductase [Planctomycetales bacterium ZRK34]|nr:Gfo/Idh/MocA family oxidoreductase [Planctomycetales bacterium ZRK34]